MILFIVPTRGKNHAMNETLRLVKVNLICCFDDNVIETPDWVRTLHRTAQHRRCVLQSFGVRVPIRRQARGQRFLPAAQPQTRHPENQP